MNYLGTVSKSVLPIMPLHIALVSYWDVVYWPSTIWTKLLLVKLKLMEKSLLSQHRMIMKHKTPNRSEHSWMLDWLVHQQEPNLWSYERSSRCRIRYSSFN